MTDGSEAEPVVIDFDKAFEFFLQIYELNPDLPYLRIQLHGGEPLLVDAKKIRSFAGKLEQHIPKERLIWSIQTNLVYSLSEERKDILMNLCRGSFGTSWDKDIRFKNQSQIRLWEKNVSTLQSEGAEITVLVSIDKSIIETDPSELLMYFASRGIQHVTFERITVDGHATRMDLPTNREVDLWFVKMWDQTLDQQLYRIVHNVYLGDIARSILLHNGAGTHCRSCETQILTVRATGEVSGCPNTANSIKYGDYSNVYEALMSDTRSKQIEKEMTVNSECLVCPAYSFCRGNCYKLEWDDHCPSPKLLFQHMMSTDDWHHLVPVLAGETEQ